MTPQEAIIRAANENGIDPALALAIAQRESSFNPNAGSGSRFSSAYGLFQLLRSERNTYGGNSNDPYEQATAWMHYIQGTRAEMAARLGRDPTGPELYLGHYFGGGRAARMVQGSIPGQTPVSSIFSAQELAANPNIARAGTSGALVSSIGNDISRRMQRFGGDGSNSIGGPDLAMWGTQVSEGQPTAAPPSRVQPKGGAATPSDESQFGIPIGGMNAIQASASPVSGVGDGTGGGSSPGVQTAGRDMVSALDGASSSV